MSQAAHAFADVDAFGPDMFVPHWMTNGVFVSGKADPVARHVAARETVAAHFSAFDGTRFRVGNVCEFGDDTFVQVDVDYLREDGTRVTVPHGNVLAFDGDVVCDWQIYVGNPR